MPANQYDKNFAGGVGANTLTPSAWAALGTLLAQGFQPGIALSEQINTLLRQLSTFMAGVSDWVELRGSLDQLDDGSVANYFAAFKSAMDNSMTMAQNIGGPIGSVTAFAGAAAPAGWMICNGALVTVAAYPALYAVIGTTYGTSNPGVNFALPDLRGRFVRGFDAGAGVDPARVLGSVQADAVRSHIHKNGVADGGTAGFVYGGTTDDMPGAATQTIDTAATARTHQGLTSAFGGTETRPVNMAMNHIIRVS